MSTRRAPRLLLLALVTVGSVALSLRVGAAPVDFARALREPASIDAAILSARLARVTLGALAGASLAAVGACYQALFRNPLGDPFALGVSGGAALGATVAVLAGFGMAFVPMASFAGAVLAMLAVLAVARGPAGRGAEGMLLAGLVSNAVSGGALSFLRAVADSAHAQETAHLLLGSVIEEPWPRVGLVAGFVAVGGTVMWSQAKALNLLALGSDSAASLGVSVPRAERTVFLSSSLVVAAVVSVCGLIPFVGLIVPHYVRRWIGGDHRWLVPACALGGATLLVLADAATRAAFLWLHSEPPVGALTALLGGPFFLVALRSRHAR